MIIGERIKAAISRSNYSVKEVAEELNTTTQNLYKLFKKDSIDSKYLENIARILNINPFDFFSDQGSETVNKQIQEFQLELAKLKNELEEFKLENQQLNNELISTYRKLTEAFENKGIPKLSDISLEDHIKTTELFEKGVREGKIEKIPKEQRDKLKAILQHTIDNLD